GPIAGRRAEGRMSGAPGRPGRPAPVCSGRMGELVIRDGVCHAMFAYDIGMAIDLEEAARLTRDATKPETIRHTRRTPVSLEFRPAPLRVIQSGAAMSIAGFHTAGPVGCVLYDFGAVSVMYDVPLACPISGLLALSDALYEHPGLLEDSRRRVE